MGFNILGKLSQASQAAEDFVNKKRNERKQREAEKAAQAELERWIAEKNDFLQLVASKRTGTSAEDMPPLMCDISATQKAVFLVTIPISFGRFKLSKNAYNLLARHVGMSMDSVSHWAIAVIDRALAPSYFYELMSDDLALNAIMKNQFRFEKITPDYIATWSSCYYVGETTRSHEQILQLGQEHLTLHPRYKLLDDNCQDMVEVLVKHLCDGKVISQAKLREELSLASPKIALDLMMAKFRSRMDTFDEHEDSEKVKNENADVNEDVNTINSLWQRIHR